jgi:hypothetical protein
VRKLLEVFIQILLVQVAIDPLIETAESITQHISRDCDWATGWTTKESWFDCRKRQGILLIPTASAHASAEISKGL